MNTDRKGKINDEKMEEMLKGSFGLSNAQILEEMRLAEERVDDDQIPPAPLDWDKQLAGRLGAERRRHWEMEKRKGEDGSHRGKIHWLRLPVRILVAAAVAMSVLVGAGVTAVGKRSYEYRQSERVDVRNNVALNNEENLQDAGELEEIYQKIGEKTGLHVMTLGYRPKGMELKVLKWDTNYVELQFEYKNRNIFFIQEYMTVDSSSNIVSDRENTESVYNSWLDQDIVIQHAEVDQGVDEYSVEIHMDKTYYYLSGIMKLEEFKKIVEQLQF